MPLVRINSRLLHFVHVPKTGGSSIKSYLAERGKIALYCWPPAEWGRTSPQHMERATHSLMVPPGFCDASFIVFRDPVDRMVSEYRYRAARGSNVMSLEFARPNLVEWIDGGVFTGSFDRWVDVVLDLYETDRFLYDNHIRPQSEFWCPTLTPFFFEDGIDRIFDWIDATCGLPERERDPKPANRSPKIAVEMSVITRRRIEAFYAADYALIRRLRFQLVASEGAPVTFGPAPLTDAEGRTPRLN